MGWRKSAVTYTSRHRIERVVFIGKTRELPVRLWFYRLPLTWKPNRRSYVRPAKTAIKRSLNPVFFGTVDSWHTFNHLSFGEYSSRVLLRVYRCKLFLAKTSLHALFELENHNQVVTRTHTVMKRRWKILSCHFSALSHTHYLGILQNIESFW